MNRAIDRIRATADRISVLAPTDAAELRRIAAELGAWNEIMDSIVAEEQEMEQLRALALRAGDVVALPVGRVA